MGNVLEPTMDAPDFFEYVYRKHKRYWRPNEHERYRYFKGVFDDSIIPGDIPPKWIALFRNLHGRSPGTALDLGAGEGADAIKLALLGYEVDALEVTAAGSEKIETFARKEGVRVNVVNQCVRDFEPKHKYDIVLCNGLLHYISDKESILKKIQNCTKDNGFNMIVLFSDYTPVPECHQIINVYCDTEDGIVKSAYEDWIEHLFLVEHSRRDLSHTGFPTHKHSYIKMVVQKSIG